jgi:hypothetical protein
MSKYTIMILFKVICHMQNLKKNGQDKILKMIKATNQERALFLSCKKKLKS